jgi:signal transduction histidine kinase
MTSHSERRGIPSAGETMLGHQPLTFMGRARVMLTLRWVLIIATSYLVIFSRPLSQMPPAAAIFVALYLGSNVLLGEMLPRLRPGKSADSAIVLIDVIAVAVAILLSGHSSGEFFALYFVVLFLSALTERLGLIVLATLLISITYLYTMSQFVGLGHLIDQGYMMRVPFLFAVALFFGSLVQGVLTQQREAEEARARAIRMELLSSISHDLKNPLGVIESLASLLLEGDAGPLNQQQADLTQRIHASARHVSRLAINLIDAERIEAGRFTLQPRPTLIGDLAEDALQLARSSANLRAITLRSYVDPDLPPLYVDPIQMQRVVANLLANAIKFSRAGGSVSLTLRNEAEQLLLSVRDDGPGISAEDLPRVFDKYHREPHSSRIEGTGLGLFIVKSVVEAHHGRIDIWSQPEVGTTVTISLPTSLLRTDVAEQPHSSEASFPDAPRLRMASSS